VASSPEISAADIADCVANLVTKSLVTTEFGGDTISYRLFETMGAYARAKLVEHGELQAFARRHAEYFRDLFQRAELE
jgi:predicted ATPase